MKQVERLPLGPLGSVSSAVAVFKQSREYDRERVFLAGEGQGAIVALRAGMASSGLYKGLLLIDAPFIEELVASRASTAAQMGQRLYMVLGVEGAEGKLAELAKNAPAWKRKLTEWGIDAAIETCAPPSAAADPRREKVALVLRKWLTETPKAPGQK